MEEKISNGAIAGIIAGILKDIPDAILHNSLKITSITFWDYAGTITLGRHPHGFFESSYSFFFEVIFSTFLGILFVNFTTHFNRKHYLLWGAFYGGIIWFFIRSIVVVSRIESLITMDFLTSLVNSINSIIYGIILGFFIVYFEKKKYFSKE
ncbi:MAG: hypothetical protein ACM3YE_06300 [Bacteroidota bacterium]